MKNTFKVGTTYRVNDAKNSTITIDRTTNSYIYFHGCYTGKKQLNNGLLNMGDYIIIPGEHNLYFYCFAKNIIE